MNREQFSIEWQGSLIAPETGWYDFRIKTRNGARLYLNTDLGEGDSNRRDDSAARRANATIDGWVTTGQDIRDETARVFLLGGRAYPLKVDYFKYKEKLGTCASREAAAWRLGGPFRALSFAAPASRVSIVATEFPPDDGSVGYERGTNVSKIGTKPPRRVVGDVGRNRLSLAPAQ
jgi:hypothetical protein